jgi:hypothetical protein
MSISKYENDILPTSFNKQRTHTYDRFDVRNRMECLFYYYGITTMRYFDLNIDLII